MKEITDPALLEELDRKEVTDPNVLADLEGDFSNVKSGSSSTDQRKYLVNNDWLKVALKTPEEIAGNPLIRYVVGAGKGLVGLGQLAEKGLERTGIPWFTAPIQAGKTVREAMNFPDLPQSVQRTEEIGKQDMASRGEKYNIAGTLGEMSNPVGLSFMKGLPVANTVGQRFAQSAGTGALFGAMQPFTGPDGTYDINKVADVVVGGLVGGVINVPFEGGRYVTNLFRQYFTESGAREVAKRYLETILGPGNLEKVVAEVQKRLPSIGKGDVPDYRPTTGELVGGMPEASPLVALQAKTATKTGGISADFGSRQNANAGAIESALRGQFGTPETLQAAESLAQSNAKANYQPLMGMKVSPESDVNILLRQIQEARGVPQWQPASGSGPYVGRAGALQQWGKSATDQAQQTSFANNWLPVPGMPRVAGRYSPNAEVADQARVAARDALYAAETRGKEAEFLQNLLDKMQRSGMLAEEGLDPMLSRPSMVLALDYAKKKAAEGPYKFPSSLDEPFSGQNLHDIKLGLDDVIRQRAADPKTAGDRSMLGAIEGTKKSFIDWVQKKLPGYERARLDFARDMTVVDQQKIGQALIEKLRSVTGSETPRAFLTAAENEAKLIKGITGQPRMALDEMLTPRQSSTVRSVSDILTDQMAMNAASRKAVLPGGDEINQMIGAQLPSILYRPVVFANYLLSVAKKKAPVVERVDRLNAMWSLYPDKFVEAMKAMNEAERNSVVKLMSSGAKQSLIAPSAISASEEIQFQQ